MPGWARKGLTKACVVVNIRTGGVLARSLRVRREVLSPLSRQPSFVGGCRRPPPPLFPEITASFLESVALPARRPALGPTLTALAFAPLTSFAGFLYF